MNIGILGNVRAGRGERLTEILRSLTPAMEGHSLFAARGFGADALPGCSEVRVADGSGYVERLRNAVRALSACSLDLLIVLGGDGLAAYAADALLTQCAYAPAILGIGLGTANVGPIITLDPDGVLPDSFDDLRYVKRGAIEALENGRHIAWGFNDVVLGDTLLATVDGQMSTVSASALARNGEIIPRAPTQTIAHNLAVMKNGKPIPLTLDSPAQIIISPLENDDLYGRAIFGVLCFAPHGTEKAAVTLSSAPLITMNPGDAGYDSFASLENLLFAPGDLIELVGLMDDGACVVADGNPYLISSGSVAFRYAPEIITVACFKGGCRP